MYFRVIINLNPNPDQVKTLPYYKIYYRVIPNTNTNPNLDQVKNIVQFLDQPKSKWEVHRINIFIA